jgi:hypothetical protein
LYINEYYGILIFRRGHAMSSIATLKMLPNMLPSKLG